MRRGHRLLAIAGLGLVALPFVWVAGGTFWARHRQAAADRHWAESFEPMDVLVARHPATLENPEARRLGELCGGLGIPISTPEASSYARLAEVERKELDRTLKAVGRWVTDQGTRTDEGLEAPPAEVAQFLSERRADIEAVEGHVLGSGDLAWESDLAKGIAAPLPRLLGHRYLQNVLLALSLESARAGNREATETALEASWRVHQSLQRRPEMLPQLMAIAVSGMQHGVLRRLPHPPDAWRERVAGADYRRPILLSLQVEAWSFGSLGRGFKGFGDADAPDPSKRSGLGLALDRLFAGPFLKLSVADYSDRLRSVALGLGTQDPCRFDGEAYDRHLQTSIPRWNILARIAMPSLSRLWPTVGRAGFDAELTRLVLEAKARRAEGRPPLTGPLDSEACQGVRWIRTVEAGTATIAPESDPFPSGSPALLPRVHHAATRFTVAARPSR